MPTFIDESGDTGLLLQHTGYLPATYRWQPSGFEWYFGPLAEHYGGDLPDGLEGREHVVNCVTFSDMQELICGLLAYSVLSQLADGVFLNEDTGQLMSADAAFKMARELDSTVKG